MAKLVIEIDHKTLDVTAEIEGMHGTGCKTKLEDAQKLLGMATLSEHTKPEMFQTAPARVQQHR